MILVTGAAGFIGAAVSTLLLARGEQVLGLDNLNDYYDVSLKKARLAQLTCQPGFTFCELDISDRDGVLALATQFHGITGIVHLAAQAGVRYSLENPFAYVQSNLMGQVVMLELARALPGLKHELFGHTYAHLFGIPMTGLRFFTVYGPWGRPDMAAFLFTRAILAGEPIKVFNHGEMWRDFTFIDDISDGVIRALDRPATGTPPHRVYNLGNSRVEKLTDYIATLEQALGKRAVLEMQPMQPGDVPRTSADIEASRRDLGFDPATPISVGLPKFVDWYRQYYRL